MIFSGRGWRDRAWVLTGRGAAGILPVVLLSLASRSLGLDVMGTFATALALTLGLAELADFFSERHIPRIVLSDAPTDEKTRRIEAFNSLRFAVFLAFGLAAFAVLATISDRRALPATTVVLVCGGMVLVAKTQYAAALADRRYALLGGGPLLGLAVAAAVAWILLRSPFKNLWAVVIALVAAKLGEIALLGTQLPWPGVNFDAGRMREEWRQIRFLFYQGVLSAANARLIVPLVAAVSGVAAAGLLSIGLSFLGIISLAAVAITVPAYRWVLELGRSHGLSEAFRRTQRDWTWAVTLSLALTATVAVVSRPLLRVLFHVDDRTAQEAVVLVVLSGTFETLNLFAGSYYHACFRDRQLFILSIVTMTVSWVALAIGVASGGVLGMGLGFMASRAVGAVALYLPIIGSLRRQDAAVAVTPLGREGPLGDD
jgi:O-antigen/teichoic acid export membrane protein